MSLQYNSYCIVSNKVFDGTSYWALAKQPNNYSNDYVRVLKSTDGGNTWSQAGLPTQYPGGNNSLVDKGAVLLVGTKLYFVFNCTSKYTYAGSFETATNSWIQIAIYAQSYSGDVTGNPTLAVSTDGTVIAMVATTYTTMGNTYSKAAVVRTPVGGGSFGSAMNVDAADQVHSRYMQGWYNPNDGYFYVLMYRVGVGGVCKVIPISGSSAGTSIAISGNRSYTEVRADIFCQYDSSENRFYYAVYNESTYWLYLCYVQLTSTDFVANLVSSKYIVLPGSGSIRGIRAIKQEAQNKFYLIFIKYDYSTHLATIIKMKYYSGVYSNPDYYTQTISNSHASNPTYLQWPAIHPVIFDDSNLNVILDVHVQESMLANAYYVNSYLGVKNWSLLEGISLQAGLITPMSTIVALIETMPYQLQIAIGLTTPMQLLNSVLKAYRYAGLGFVSLAHKLTGVNVPAQNRKYLLDVVIAGVTYSIPLFSFVLRKALAANGETVMSASFVCPLDTFNIIGMEISFQVKLWSVISGVSFLLLDGIFQGIGINSNGCVMTATGTSQPGPLKEISADGLSYVRGGVDSKTFRASPNFNLNIGDYFLVNGLPVRVSSIVIYVSVDQQFMEVS